MRHISELAPSAALAGLLALLALPAAAQSTVNVDMVNAEGETIGSLELTDTANGVLIEGELEGLPPGTHGFHLHETGACEAPFESAGSHFNPEDTKHGFLAQGGPHAGDMPNFTVGEDGTAQISVFNSMVRLEEGGAALIDDDGAAVMVHSGEDDYQTDPGGDAGDRIACGVVEAAT